MLGSIASVKGSAFGKSLNFVASSAWQVSGEIHHAMDARMQNAIRDRRLQSCLPSCEISSLVRDMLRSAVTAHNWPVLESGDVLVVISSTNVTAT